jgi:hypothetical protein
MMVPKVKAKDSPLWHGIWLAWTLCKVKEGLLQLNPNILNEILKQPLYGNKNSQMKHENYGAFNQIPNFTNGSLKAFQFVEGGKT